MNNERTTIATNWLKQNLADIVPKSAFTDKDLMVDTIYKLIATESQNRPIATSSLLHLLEADYATAKSIFLIIETGLLHVESIEAASKISLIDTLIALTFHDSNISLDTDNIITRADAGKLALSVLEREVNTNADTGQLIQTINLVRLLGYRPALAVIDSIVKNATEEKLKSVAKKTLFALNNSLESIWIGTNSDHTSTLEQRNNHIVESVYDATLNEYEYIQALFNATKDSPIESDDDPRVNVIEKLLDQNATYEILRLAAAYAVLQVSISESKLVKQAIDAVTDIGINGVAPNMCTEAASLLESIESKFPHRSKQIEQSRKKANIEFLKKFKL